MNDRDRVWARFEHRFAGIEREVPEVPSLPVPVARRRVATIAGPSVALLVVVAAVVVIGAVIGAAPGQRNPVGAAPSASIPPTQSATGEPSRLEGVKISCAGAPNRPTPPPDFTCDRVIKAALEVLPPGRISELEFGYGGFCPPGARCAVSPPTRAHVLVTWTGDAQPVVVGVSIDDAGILITSSPEPFSISRP